MRIATRIGDEDTFKRLDDAFLSEIFLVLESSEKVLRLRIFYQLNMSVENEVRVVVKKSFIVVRIIAYIASDTSEQQPER